MNAMKNILLALSLFAAATTSATTLRGDRNPMRADDEKLLQDQRSNRRRKLLQSSTCTLFKKCMTYKPTDDHPHGYHHDSWVCKLSKEDAETTDADFVDIVEPHTIEALENATSGESELHLTEAVIDMHEEPRMFIPHNSRAQVVQKRVDTSQSRILAAQQGTLDTLVIRLVDRRNAAPDASISKLQNDFFGDSVSLKTQTEACSYGKLKIDPFSGTSNRGQYIRNGVVDVEMDFDVNSGEKGISNAAMKAAKAQVGDLDSSKFGLVVFCFPEGSHSFLAYAYANSKFTFYNNAWCGFVSAQMHEVGHNLNLGHSGQDNGKDDFDSVYGDGTGMMGSSIHKDDVKMCYNPQKSYQLGWYSDKTETINPLAPSNNGLREFDINGIADYRKGSNDALVVLRLNQVSREQDYYIGYNRATGINADTSEDGDKITIIRKEVGDPKAYSQSLKVAALTPGQSHTIKDFNGDRNVRIFFAGIRDGTARLHVIDVEKHQPEPYPPSNCQKFKIEMTTDTYPEDNRWVIIDTEGWGRVGAISYSYGQENWWYNQEICLPSGASTTVYRFTFFDEYGDGLRSGGRYKIKDANGKTLFEGSHLNGKFHTREHDLVVAGRSGPSSTNKPTRAPTSKPTSGGTVSRTPCQDKEEEKFHWKKKPGVGKPRGCAGLSKTNKRGKNKCDRMTHTGEYVWQRCKKSCDRCDN